MPAGATVKVTCKKGCSRKSYTVTKKKRGTVSLKRLVRKRLRAGTTIRVVVSRPGNLAAIKTLKVRSKKAPDGEDRLARALRRSHAAHRPGQEHGAERDRDPEHQQRLEVAAGDEVAPALDQRA